MRQCALLKHMLLWICCPAAWIDSLPVVEEGGPAASVAALQRPARNGRTSAKFSCGPGPRVLECGQYTVLRGRMRPTTFAALCGVALTAVSLALALPAQAQTRRYYPPGQTERITVVDETGRRTTRITVRPRSFLDPGTAT